MSDEPLQISAIPRLTDIEAAEWDACANPSGRWRMPGEEGLVSYDPFLSHAFLSALEESGSAVAATGWQPQHLAVHAGERLVAAMPCYLKSHSRGEYVFDQGWADAYMRAGGRYYPKLQCSVPFTPVTGRRLLVRPGEQEQEARSTLIGGAQALTDLRRASSLHVTFPTDEDADALEAAGFLPRTDQQFHWSNAGYDSHEQFLGELASRKRKALRRERQEAVANGITIHWITGRDLTENVWDAFFAFYMDTGDRKWGRPYLTRTFFSLVGERLGDDILLVMAKRAGRWIAGALNFVGSHAIYGRHWGCVEQHPFLHFEVCYHQAIDYAIAHRLPRVEAGAQGEHKLARGYLPVTTRSAHYIADPGFREAVADYLARERAYVAEAGRELLAQAPFRKDMPAEEIES